MIPNPSKYRTLMDLKCCRSLQVALHLLFLVLETSHLCTSSQSKVDTSAFHPQAPLSLNPFLQIFLFPFPVCFNTRAAVSGQTPVLPNDISSKVPRDGSGNELSSNRHQLSRFFQAVLAAVRRGTCLKHRCHPISTSAHCPGLRSGRLTARLCKAKSHF